MQALSETTPGNYTVKWMFGSPEILSWLRERQFREGQDIQVISRQKGSLIVGIGRKRIALGDEVACRIQV